MNCESDCDLRILRAFQGQFRSVKPTAVEISLESQFPLIIIVLEGVVTRRLAGTSFVEVRKSASATQGGRA